MNCTLEEFLICALTDLIGPVRHVAVGAASPIPAAASLLAQAEASSKMQVTILHSKRHNRFTDGGVELFDCAAQGRIDLFFLGGVQIDGEANLNLVGTGDYPTLHRRFPGSFGSSYLYFTVPRVILFRADHDLRTLVHKVDFISAPGWSAPEVDRPGGPSVLVTNLAAMRFDRDRRRFVLASVHPGHSVDEIVDKTGFSIDVPDEVAMTPEPQHERLELLRDRIAPQINDSYPAFAATAFAQQELA